MLVVVAILFFLSPIFVEGLTELICKSEIFSGLRAAVSSRSSFFRRLLSCGYCTSVWVAPLTAALVTYFLTPSWPLRGPLFVFITVVFHRLSNYVHNFNDKHLDKFYDKKD